MCAVAHKTLRPRLYKILVKTHYATSSFKNKTCGLTTTVRFYLQGTFRTRDYRRKSHFFWRERGQPILSQKWRLSPRGNIDGKYPELRKNLEPLSFYSRILHSWVTTNQCNFLASSLIPQQEKSVIQLHFRLLSYAIFVSKTWRGNLPVTSGRRYQQNWGHGRIF